MFLHSDLFYIMFNVIFQLDLGIPLEMVHCWWRVCLIYLSGVFAGSIDQSYFKPCKNLIGASAGVYAIITSHVATIILNWHEMKYGAVQLFVFLIVCSCNIFTDVFQESRDNTGHTAHLFGAIAGILVGIGVLRNLRVRPYQKKTLACGCWCSH
jgi:rhomboid-related protein 1/2/3